MPQPLSSRSPRSVSFARRGAALALVALAVLPTATPAGELPRQEGRYELAEGLVVERRLAPRGEDGRNPALVSLVRVDPARFDLQLFTAAQHGGARTAEAWLEEFGLAGVANASMYLPNLRSTGFMVDGDRTNNGAVNPRFGGFFCFGPTREGLPPVVVAGVDCPGFSLERLREDYRVIVQDYRLLGCRGEPVEWNAGQVYPGVALAVDEDGWAVFLHTTTPFRMREFSRWLARPELGLVGAVFAEGGSDSSLLVRHEGLELREVGLPLPGLVGRAPFVAVPNVIGFVPRPR